MGERRGGIAARHHPGDLALSGSPVNAGNGRVGDDAGGVFCHDEVPIRESGHLRQVGDDDDLTASGELGQAGTDIERRPAPNAGVDLVEDERGHGPR